MIVHRRCARHSHTSNQDNCPAPFSSPTLVHSSLHLTPSPEAGSVYALYSMSPNLHPLSVLVSLAPRLPRSGSHGDLDTRRASAISTPLPDSWPRCRSRYPSLVRLFYLSAAHLLLLVSSRESNLGWVSLSLYSVYLHYLLCPELQQLRHLVVSVGASGFRVQERVVCHPHHSRHILVLSLLLGFKYSLLSQDYSVLSQYFLLVSQDQCPKALALRLLSQD